MAKVKFKRFLSDGDLDNVALEDGSFIVTKSGTSYVDYADERVAFGGTADAEMDDESINSVQNKVVKSYIDDTASEINSNFGGKILWTNSSPTSSFASQTITLSESLANYDCYEIMFRQSTRTARIMTSGKVPVGNGTILNWNAATTSGNVYFRATGPTVSGTSISFEDAKNSGTVDNLSTIPMYVIAYKTNLFS